MKTLIGSKYFLIQWILINYIVLLFLSGNGYTQSFQRNYGTPLDNSFSKVIPDGSEYYVLGQDQPIAGALSRATVTRLAADGSLLWTKSLDIPSQWNDAIRVKKGDLILVGNSLPGDATSKSIMGRITNTGNYDWLKSYDDPGGRDFFLHIIENPFPQNPNFPYYVIGGQKEVPGLSGTWDDVVMLNINGSGNFNWKKIYISNSDDEFFRDFIALPNGQMIISGSRLNPQNDHSGIFYVTNTDGSLISGKIANWMNYPDIALSPFSGEYFMASNSEVGQSPFISKFDQNYTQIWQIQIPKLTSVSQIWEASPGVIYATGIGSFANLTRTVLLKLQDNTPNIPTLLWTKYLNSGNSFIGGTSWLLPTNKIAFTDGRIVPLGFGGRCAFMSISDLELNTCNVSNETILFTPTNLAPLNQILFPINTIDTIPGVNISNSFITWGEKDPCQTCCADSTTFSNLVNQGFTVVMTNCKVTVTAPQFDTCYLFSTPPSLDGGNVSQVITNPNGSWTYNFTQNGTHQICVNVFDECNSKKMCTSFNITACDTCVCGPFDIMYAISRGPLFPVKCGETLSVPSSVALLPIRFFTSFNCIGTNCPQPTVDWILTGPTGFFPVSMNGINATPTFSIPITNTTFSIAGLYTLTINGHCGNNICPCIIYFNADGPSCCSSYSDFCLAVMNAISLIADNNKCKATLNIGNLPKCDSIGPVFWGDGTSTSGHFGSGTMPMHSYFNSGTYYISWTALEYDYSVMPPRPCFDKVFRDSIKISCSNQDTCVYKLCTTSSWQNLSNSTFIYDMKVYQGKLIVAGSFNLSGAMNIAAWNGTTWSSLGSGINGTVEALEVHNGLLYAGGSFTNPGSNLAVWNGINWNSVGGGTNGTVYKLLSFNSNLIAGGLFSSPNSNIAQWNGINWTGLGSGTNGKVTGLGTFNGTLIAGGIFNLAGGNNVSNIAQWNGNWSALLGGGINLFNLNNGQGVSAIQQLNNELIVGGRFMDASGIPGTSCIAKWNGTSWISMAGGVNTTFEGIYDLKIYGGDLYAGGLFNKIGNNLINGVARWDGSSWLSTNHADQLVRSLECYMAANNRCDLYSGGEVFLNHWECLTSTEETGILDFTMFPNPTSGIMTIMMHQKAKSEMYFRFTDIAGRTVLEIPAIQNTDIQELEIFGLSSGLYFLQVISNGKVVAIKKLIIQTL